MLAGSRLLRGRVSLIVAFALLMLARDVQGQSATYTHEPAGFVPYASSTLDAFTGGGWNIVNNAATATIVSDPGGSVTPPNVGQWNYPIGMGGGSAPATMYHPLPGPFNEGFYGFMWKPSSPWQGHSSFVNKINFLLGSGCNLYTAMYGPNGGPYHFRVAPEWTSNWNWITGNVNDPAITLGVWHKIEVYFKYNTPGTGVLRFWMDGVAIGDYSNITFPSSGCFVEFQLSPTWGGVNDTKTEADSYRFDDVYISVPGSGVPPTCTFSLPVTSSSPSSGSTTGTASVTASSTTCAWTAASNASWITVTGGSSGTGNGTVSYSITANTGATARSGTITIAGQTFTVNQAGTTTPPPTSPGTVSNLSVSSLTATSATLSFTEVTDGAGAPAQYDVRFAPGTISWGSAASVTSGTCTTPLAGTTIGAIKTCTVTGLTASTAYQFQLIAFKGTLNVDAVFGGISNVASGTTQGTTPPPPPPPSTVLFTEAFADGNVAGRGWYDNTTVSISTAEHAAGSASSLQYTFNAGATAPTTGSALRHKFTASDSVYLGYWVKYSTNWVGSQKPYHPHEFHFLTTLDGDFSGLSFDHLTAYVEQNGGTPRVQIQDGSNVDQTRIGTDLTAVTESRGVAGCNGSSDGYADSCYSNGTQMVNEKKWVAAAQYFTDTPGAFYKSDWHFVEAFWQMNSIVGGKGVNNGVVQYWFDGTLLIDKHDVLLRTGANPTMQFNQLVIAPWIGDGSPVTQSFWIDNLTVGTARPAAPPPTCTYTLSPTGVSPSAAAATGSVGVTASATTCGWTAASNASWITVTSGASGTGNGSVGYSVAANATTSTRTGTVTIAGQTFTVTQAGVACTFTLSPTGASPGAAASSATVGVTAAASSCTWTAASNASWITITSGASGTGNGTVGYSVAANTSAARTGTMTIAGTSFSVAQSAAVPCTYTISPLTQAVGVNGATTTVGVTTSSSCTWTAASGAAWLSVTSPTGSASGNGTVTLQAQANSGTAPRTGTATIAGQTASFSQPGTSSIGSTITDFNGDGVADTLSYNASTGVWSTTVTGVGAGASG